MANKNVIGELQVAYNRTLRAIQVLLHADYIVSKDCMGTTIFCLYIC